MASAYFQVQLSVQPKGGGEAVLVPPAVLQSMDYHLVIVKEGGAEAIVKLDGPNAALKQVEKHFGGIASGARPAPVRQVEPEQQAERRVILRKEGTTAYWKAAYHAPAFSDADFFPLLVADAVLNGAAGLNIWSLGGVARPQ